jgi:hypothetical protein
MKFQCIVDKAKYNVGRHRLYSRIDFYLLKTIQSSFQLLISTLKIYGSIVQNNYSRLFQTIYFLQLLFLLLKFYFFFKIKITVKI